VEATDRRQAGDRGLELLAEQRFIEVGGGPTLTTEQNQTARAGSATSYDALTAALMRGSTRWTPAPVSRRAATAMVEAHGRLRAAVADPETQMAAVIAALKRFTDAARELRDGLAGKTSQGS
jgi:hypothetical protein